MLRRYTPRPRAAVVPLAVLAWQGCTDWTNHPYFPPPSHIASTAWQLWLSGPLLFTPAWSSDILPSVARLLGAWTAALLVGVPLGITLGRCPRITAYVSLPLYLARATPTTLLIPIVLALLGLTPAMTVAVIGLGALWPILLTTIDGARNINPVQLDTVRAFRTHGRVWIVYIVLPAAAPRIVTGMRQSLSLACILLVVAEMTGVPNGIGARLVAAQSQFDINGMWAWLVLLAALGASLNGLLMCIERRLLSWHYYATHPDASRT